MPFARYPVPGLGPSARTHGRRLGPGECDTRLLRRRPPGVWTGTAWRDRSAQVSMMVRTVRCTRPEITAHQSDVDLTMLCPCKHPNTQRAVWYGSQGSQQLRGLARRPFFPSQLRPAPLRGRNPWALPDFPLESPDRGPGAGCVRQDPRQRPGFAPPSPSNEVNRNDGRKYR